MSRPDLHDLYVLAGQLERDREEPLDALKRRDHELAAGIAHQGDVERLLAWLDKVADRDGTATLPGIVWLRLSRVLLGLLGFAAMGGFLLSSSRGLVNVLILLGLFAALQLLMSFFAFLALLRTVTGHTPTTLPASPARWLVQRSLPDGRYLREASGVLRLLFLRYGQEWGLWFTVGALLAFALVPGISDFSFVWGSTFALGDDVMRTLTDTLAAPWSALLPGAIVSPEVVASSRYHPALVNLDRSSIEGMRGWWSFLFMCLLVYALLPRVLLWLGARCCYPWLMRRSFLHYPGAGLVLQRLKMPLVSTQADPEGGGYAADVTDSPAATGTVPDGHLLLLDWGGALGGGTPARFEELLSVDSGNIVVAGRGELARDLEQLRERSGEGFNHLLVVVKSWEPPMAELADLVAELAAIPRCTIYLLPLPERAVPHRKVEDWRGFARGLPIASVDVRLLNPVVGV